MLSCFWLSRQKVHDFFELANGFSAVLTTKQAAELQGPCLGKLFIDCVILACSSFIYCVPPKPMPGHPEVLFVVKDSFRKLQTTESFKFLGLDRPDDGLWKKSRGSNTIIAIIDSGIILFDETIK